MPSLCAPLCCGPRHGQKVELCTVRDSNFIFCVIDTGSARGHAIFAQQDLPAGSLVLQEAPLCTSFPAKDVPWFSAMRRALNSASSACGWQYCLAAYCLGEEEFPFPFPPGLRPMIDVNRALFRELCGGIFAQEDEPTLLATLAADFLLRAAALSWSASAARRLGLRLDAHAKRIGRNGFQVVNMDERPPLPGDAVFHYASFFNHSCAGQANVTWTFHGGSSNLLSVSTTRDVKAGEELTISYMSKPWEDFGRSARQLYLWQNFGFRCLCVACSQSHPEPGQEQFLDTDDKRTEEALSGSRNQESGAGSKLSSFLYRWITEAQEVHSEYEY